MGCMSQNGAWIYDHMEYKMVCLIGYRLDTLVRAGEKDIFP